MKKFLLVIIASAILMCGCNNSELDNSSSSVGRSNESGTQTNGPSSAEITVSEPVSESFTISQHTSTNEPISGNTSLNTSSTSVQNSSTLMSSSTSLTSSASSSSSVSNNSQSTELPTNKEENDLNITVTINGRNFSATLYYSETAKEFKARLPLTLDMSELNGNEKYYYLPDSLPTNSSRPSKINSGDIMLYGSSCLVIFYESFFTSYSYTPIGKIDDPAGLAAVLGSGSVQVTFNAAPNN